MARTSVLVTRIIFTLGLVACGPQRTGGGDDQNPDEPCNPGAVEECYDGTAGTDGVGPCHKGTRTCTDQKIWTACDGEVLPIAEACADGVDNDCNGMTDEDIDADGDGFTTCGGDCCDSVNVCGTPGAVNPGAFDAPGNNFDDDCNGVLDDTVALCDQGIASNTADPMDFAKAMELCQTTTMADKKWGVISAKFTLADGTGAPATQAHAVRPRFGTNIMPRAGGSLALLSTGHAAAKGDTNPSFQDFEDLPFGDPGNGKESNFPADFLQANGNKLPNAPGCPAIDPGSKAEDPMMLTLQIRVPTNAKSFKLENNFFSSEFPEYTCSAFNDFFVVLLDSAFSGTPANPTDKNLAFYAPPNSMQKFPVGVNLASGNTGLFTQCINGKVGCAPGSKAGTISTCVGFDQLANTGFDTPKSGECDTNSKEGGGTGWLTTSGNVNGGEIITLRIAIWDTSDHILDSIVAVDNFQWSVDATDPGTVIFRK